MEHPRNLAILVESKIGIKNNDNTSFMLKTKLRIKSTRLFKAKIKSKEAENHLKNHLKWNKRALQSIDTNMRENLGQSSSEIVRVGGKRNV